jgi:hypothetical protein
MGPYPLFACRAWENLSADLAELDGDLLSVSIVTDPFGDFTEEALRRSFPHLVLPFKDHYISDLQQNPQDFVSSHHRYYARRALKEIGVHVVDSPLDYLQEWVDLYDVLIQRHDIKGIPAFSPDAFAEQLTVPGLVMFRAVYKSQTVGCHLWYQQEDVAYSHLTAFNEEGYEHNASYGLHWEAMRYFGDKVRWLHLGAGAGVNSDQSSGLDFFKKGWATDTRLAYFCGRIINEERYDKVTDDRQIDEPDYFPAYRQGEFG